MPRSKFSCKSIWSNDSNDWSQSDQNSPPSACLRWRAQLHERRGQHGVKASRDIRARLHERGSQHGVKAPRDTQASEGGSQLSHFIIILLRIIAVGSVHAGKKGNVKLFQSSDAAV